MNIAELGVLWFSIRKNNIDLSTFYKYLPIVSIFIIRVKKYNLIFNSINNDEDINS